MISSRDQELLWPLSLLCFNNNGDSSTLAHTCHTHSFSFHRLSLPLPVWVVGGGTQRTTQPRNVSLKLFGWLHFRNFAKIIVARHAIPMETAHTHIHQMEWRVNEALAVSCAFKTRTEGKSSGDGMWWIYAHACSVANRAIFSLSFAFPFNWCKN